MRVPEFLTEPTFASELEQRYCMLMIDRAETAYVRGWYGLCIVYWGLLLILGWFGYFDDAVCRVLVMTAPLMTIASIVAPMLARKLTVLRYLQLLAFTCGTIIQMIAARADIQDGAGSRVFAAIWIFSGTVGMALLAFRNYVHSVMLVIYLATLAYGLQGYPEPLYGWAFGALLGLASSNAFIFSHRAMKRQSIRSFRQQSMCTPKQVLVHAIQAKRPITEVFGPEQRHCVCICSDWRRFQTFTTEVTAERLASILEAYYTEQLRLLEIAFPEGNYFLDWIADELFAVGFVTHTSDENAIAHSAVIYAQLCLATRPVFTSRHGAPRGIDIGISQGHATVGMLGPQGNKKATALGKVPGMARRLQTVGKELRQIAGSIDRIVIDPAMGPLLAGYREFEQVELPPTLVIKDLNLSSVLVLAGSESKSATRTTDQPPRAIISDNPLRPAVNGG